MERSFAGMLAGRAPARWLCAAMTIAVNARAGAAADAPDICHPGEPPAKVYVGAGGDCDYHSIQDAIDATGDAGGCGASINITPESDWTNQTIEIHGNKKIGLIGWGSGETCTHLKFCTMVGCTFNAYPPLPITPASGHSGLYVTGDNNTITLTNLEFHGASLGADHGGGGIAFDGSGSLALDTVTIDNNTAGWGGGLWFNGAGSLTFTQNVIVNLNHATSGQGGGVNVSTTGTDPIAFTIGQNSSVQNNSAPAGGGGILIQHNVHLVATAPGIWITHNSALNGDGGGLYVGGSAVADIGSPGILGTLPVIDSNSAEYGGGVAAAAFVGEVPLVRVFTTDAQHPVQISGNIASHTGGGVYLRPIVAGATGLYPAYFCASDFRIDANSAQEGSAIYGDEDHSDIAGWVGSEVALDDDSNDGDDACSTVSLAALGAVACAPGVACDEIDGNIARTTDGTATDGAAILMQTGSFLYANRFGMRGNEGGKAMRFLTDGDGFTFSQAELHDCVLAGNDVTESLIEATPGDGDAHDLAIIDSCTIADNTIGADSVIQMQLGADSPTFHLTNTIIDQPGRDALYYSGPSAGDVAYDLTSDASLTGSNLAVGAPSFVDAAAGDYRLLPSSLGVDYAPPGSTGIDLDGHTRVVDLPGAPNAFGPMDLGAYEIQAACSVADTVFCDGFDG
jgi:hypothetical protein